MSEKQTLFFCLRQAHWGPCCRLSCISIWESYDDDKSDDIDNTKKSIHENKKNKINHSYKNQEISNYTQTIPIQPIQKCNDPKCIFKVVC